MIVTKQFKSSTEQLQSEGFLIEKCWGFRLPHARTGGVLIVAQRRVKHTDTIFYVVRQNRLHPREKSILLEMDRERVTTHMEEEAHFTQTQLSLLSHTAAQGSRAAALGSYSFFLSSRISLLFSSTLSICSHKIMPLL